MTRCIRFVLSLGLFATLAASARAENSPRFPALAASPPPRTQEAAAQPERIATLIERIKASGQSFREVQPFHPGLRTENAAPETRETLKQGLLLSVEFGKLQALLKETPNNVVFTTLPHRSVVDAFDNNVAKNGPRGASNVSVASTPPKIPKISA